MVHKVKAAHWYTTEAEMKIRLTALNPTNQLKLNNRKKNQITKVPFRQQDKMLVIRV